jgi:hypothetical protein
MVPPTKSNWIAPTGLAIASVGVVLFMQLGRIVDLRLDLIVLNVTVLGSFVATIGGLLTATMGCVTWSRGATTRQLIWAAVSTCIVVFLVGFFGNINVHGSGFILIFVVGFGMLDAALLFTELGSRFKR